MTVTSSSSRLQFTGDGTEASLAVTFEFFDAADLAVTRRLLSTGAESTMVLNTDYTVTGGGGSTGTVEVVDGTTDFPLDDVTWTITRSEPKTQTYDPAQSSAISTTALSNQLDRMTMRMQQLQEQIDRCLKYPITDATAREDILDNSVDRASKDLQFDASGDPTSATP